MLEVISLVVLCIVVYLELRYIGVPKPMAPKVSCAWCGHTRWYRMPRSKRTTLKGASLWSGLWYNTGNAFLSSVKTKELQRQIDDAEGELLQDWDMQVIEERQGEFFWQYRNIDGSPDRRHKDNYQVAAYTSFWQCNRCSAVTEAISYLDKNPTINTKPFRLKLFQEGLGERTAKHWEGPATIQWSSEARRRSDDR